jgi:hypothetical protein
VYNFCFAETSTYLSAKAVKCADIISQVSSATLVSEAIKVYLAGINQTMSVIP